MKKIAIVAILAAIFAHTNAYADFVSEFAVGKVRLEGAVNSSGVTVLSEGGDLNILSAKGTTVPTDGTSGYAKGCVFFDTDEVTGVGGTYVNIGLSTSCKFRSESAQSLHVMGNSSIATTGTTTFYAIAPMSGRVTGVTFSASTGVAANDSKYIEFTITNKGQSGNGTAVMLATTSTTKASGVGTVTADAAKSLNLTSTLTDRDVVKGDRLKISATANGTLDAAVTYPVYLITIGGN